MSFAADCAFAPGVESWRSKGARAGRDERDIMRNAACPCVCLRTIARLHACPMLLVIARHDYTKSGATKGSKRAAEALRAEAQNTQMEQIKVPFGRL